MDAFVETLRKQVKQQHREEKRLQRLLDSIESMVHECRRTQTITPDVAIDAIDRLLQKR